jgi:hypothetical protein
MRCNRVEATAVEIEPAPTWVAEAKLDARPDWRTVDRALRAIRHSRAALDAEEMRLLREAEALQIWRPLGMVSALDYLERELGYAPRTAQDRLRVARALGSLPELTAALAGDQLPFSAVRELTRVATPATEAAWIAAATGKNLRQIEELVADHHSGDQPDDPPDPKARTHVVRFELAAETFALLRQARTVLNDEHGTNLTDDSFVTALCNAVLDSTPQAELTGRAKFQIAVTVCQHCRRGWQEGSGAQIPINPEAVDRAMCDAQHIGSIDGPAPERAYQDIPPSVARFVWRRDGGRCRVDGCRSARGLELHHIIHRADGGSHDASNIVLCCSSCHQSHHAGMLTISGTAEHLVVRRPGQSASTANTHDLPINAVSIANTSAHDATTSTTTSAANAGGHAGVANATAPATDACAHVGAAGASLIVDAPVSLTVDAHVREAATTTSVSNSGAHVGAPVETIQVARTGACSGVANRATSIANAAVGRMDAANDGVPIIDTRAHVGAASRLDAVILRTQAKAALTGMGWKPAIAHAAVAAAVAAAAGTEVTLEKLIFESLRRCPSPKA